MPLIKNFGLIEETETVEIADEAINSALASSGMAPKYLAPQDNDPDGFKAVLNNSGASVENAAKTISRVMQHGKFENSQLRAAEMALDLHGVRDKDGKVIKQPVFNFLIRDSTVNLNEIFAPLRSSIAPKSPIIDIEPEDISEEES
jgi:hypothetical protein